MTPIAFALRAALAAALCATPCVAQEPEWLIAPGRAGQVEIGMDVDQVYRIFGREHVRLVAEFLEGHFSPALQVFASYEQGAPMLVTRIAQVCGNFVVTGIEVFSPRFRTAADIGVGARIADVRRAYPDARRNVEENPAYIVSRLRLTFGVSDFSLADSLPVTSIWTWAPLPDSVSARCR